MSDLVDLEPAPEVVEPELLFPEAQQRARRRHWWVSGAVLAVAFTAIVLMSLARGSGHGDGIIIGTGGRGSASVSGGQSATSVGVVIGVATPCAGVAAGPQWPVRVTLLQNSRVVSTQTVTGNHRFRFTAPPGRYQLESDQAGTKSAELVIRSGNTTGANLLSLACG